MSPPSRQHLLNTTANLPPVFLDIIEHQEVAERRVIHGRDMTFHAPVFGEVVSNGGKIRLEDSLGWGTVINPEGHIRAAKRAFNATLQALGGIVEIALAESCIIVGREVIVREAVKCRIFAWLARPDAFRPLVAAGGHWVLDNAKGVAPA